MAFQAYLDAIETKTGSTPEQLVALAHGRGFGPQTKAQEMIDWLKADFGLGRGHAMALIHVIKNGDTISDKHVGSTGVHRDESTTLNLKGRSADPRS